MLGKICYSQKVKRAITSSTETPVGMIGGQDTGPEKILELQ
jgi:hypothetical protein